MEWEKWKTAEEREGGRVGRGREGGKEEEGGRW